MSSLSPSIRLSRLLRELENAGFDCHDLSYRKVWEGAVEARFPAHQVNGLWHFSPKDALAIGAVYGLARKQEGRAVETNDCNQRARERIREP